MTSETESPVKPGDVIDGRYRVERVLGIGGMGVVVAARHLELKTRVALKFMLPEAVKDQESLTRFQREARAAVRLKSQNTARVIDVGKLKNGAPYIVMELLTGRDLGSALEAGPLGIEEAVDFILQACEGIAEAHSNNIIHRDLKPRNLFLTRHLDGRPLIKVLDFGLAKSADLMAGDRGLTKTKAVMGSPQYMSPEQMKASRDVDGRTDIWSLGVCLYELLTGKLPFDADTVPLLCVMVMKEPPLHPIELRPDMSPGLAEVVMRCLEKDPALRFADVAELAAALEPFGPAGVAGSADRVRRVLTSSGIQGEQDYPVDLGAGASSFTQLQSSSETHTSAAFDTHLTRPPRTRWSRTMWVGAMLGLLLGIGGALGLSAVGRGYRASKKGTANVPPSAEVSFPPVDSGVIAATAAPPAPVRPVAPLVEPLPKHVTATPPPPQKFAPRPATPGARPKAPPPAPASSGVPATVPSPVLGSSPAPVPAPRPSSSSHGSDHM